MDNFNEKIKYINCTLDKIYGEIAANTGKKAAFEERIKGGSGTRLVLRFLESGFVLGLIVTLLAAFIYREQSGEIILKYGTFFVVGAVGVDLLSGKYRRASRCLALLQEREQVLRKNLDVFLAQREALLAGEEIQLMQFVPPENVKEEKSSSVALAVLLLVVVGIWGRLSLTLPDFSKKHQSDNVQMTYNVFDNTNNAGKVKSAEKPHNTGNTKAIDLTEGTGQISGDDDVKHIRLEWDYNFTDWSQEMDIPVKTYEYYKNKSKRMISSDYRQYIYEVSDDTFVKNMADNMTKRGAENGYNELEQIEMIVAFVQSLDYVRDMADNGEDIEYPKYPIETLYDKGGDCEDTSILLASLIRAKGYGVALIQMENHMAVGIKASDNFGNGSYYEVDGDKYYYVESTAKGWDIGAIPEEYKNMEAEVLVVD